MSLTPALSGICPFLEGGQPLALSIQLCSGHILLALEFIFESCTRGSAVSGLQNGTSPRRSWIVIFRNFLAL